MFGFIIAVIIFIIIGYCIINICKYYLKNYKSYSELQLRRAKNRVEFDELFSRAMNSHNPGVVFASHPNYGKWGSLGYEI